MTDTTEQPKAQAVATVQRREVQSSVPMMDSGQFEHILRIAQTMSFSTFLPTAFYLVDPTVTKPEEQEWLPDRTILANCFLVANTAVRWGMDPFSVAQCCSLVRGRLMFEGKLVAAVIDAKLGIELDYEFGRWDPKSESCILGSGEGEGDMLGVRVKEVGGRGRFVDGSVGIWKTSGSGSPWRAGAMKRQCRYRGAREWTRAFESAILLGVYTDDEMEDLRSERASLARAPEAVAALTSRLQGGGGGFSAQTSEHEPAQRVAQKQETVDADKPVEKPKDKAAGAAAGSDGADDRKQPETTAGDQRGGDGAAAGSDQGGAAEQADGAQGADDAGGEGSGRDSEADGDAAKDDSDDHGGGEVDAKAGTAAQSDDTFPGDVKTTAEAEVDPDDETADPEFPEGFALPAGEWSQDVKWQFQALAIELSKATNMIGVGRAERARKKVFEQLGEAAATAATAMIAARTKALKVKM